MILGFVLSDQGKYDEALEMFDKALSTFTRALGIDNRENAKVYHHIAFVKHDSGDMAGALASAREAVRIFNNHDINNATSLAAVDLLRGLEGGA
jgi:tetratricopeptide (TPR) repeat protein